MATHHQPTSINISSELLFLISLINLTKLLNLCYAFFQHNFNLLPVLLLSELESILSMSFKLSLVHVIRKLYVWPHYTYICRNVIFSSICQYLHFLLRPFYFVTRHTSVIYIRESAEVYRIDCLELLLADPDRE